MNVLSLFNTVQVFVFDVDGVLTNGQVLLLENGLQARSMNIKDGLALQVALQQGYRVIIVSGGYSTPVLDRLKYLGLEEVYLAVKDKATLLETLLAEKAQTWNNVLYMGDDLPDLPALQKAGLACCPADAVPEVKEVCTYIAQKNGGEGCVREVIERTLRLAGRWAGLPQVTSK